MKSKPVFAAAAAVLTLVVLAVGWAFFLPQPDRWVSQKGAARDFGEVEFFTQTETLIPGGLKTLRTAEVTREQVDEKLSFIWEELKRDWNRAQNIGRVPPRHTDDGNQVVTLPGGGRIRVGWAGMGYDPDLGDFPVREPFTPTQVTVRGDTWEPLDEETSRRFQVEELKLPSSTKPYISTWRPGEFSLNLHFLQENLTDFRTVGSIKLMNLDTKTPVRWDTGGGFNTSPSGRFHSNPAVKVFYPAHIAAGFDVAYGPCDEVRIPLRSGSRGKVPDLEIEVIAVERFSWRTAYTSNRLRQSGSRETRSLSFDLDPKQKPKTQIIYSISAPELGRFCDIVLMKHNGEEETLKLDRTYTISYLSTETLPEDLDAMILRYRPNQARVVFELPPLDGVPERNRNIGNLFDVTLPHLIATDGWEVEQTVSSQAGVQFNFPDAEFPEDYFPRPSENVTLRELLEEYLAQHPDGTRVRLDPISHKLFIPERFSWKKKWTDLRKWMGI